MKEYQQSERRLYLIYFSYILFFLTLCIGEAHKRVLLQTVKTRMKCHIMRHFTRVYTVCKGKKISSDKRIQYFLEIITRHPYIVDMYYGPSQVYRIKPEGRIH